MLVTDWCTRPGKKILVEWRRVVDRKPLKECKGLAQISSLPCNSCNSHLSYRPRWGSPLGNIFGPQRRLVNALWILRVRVEFLLQQWFFLHLTTVFKIAMRICLLPCLIRWYSVSVVFPIICWTQVDHSLINDKRWYQQWQTSEVPFFSAQLHFQILWQRFWLNMCHNCFNIFRLSGWAVSWQILRILIVISCFHS